MNRIGNGWLVLLALPTLAVTVHLSALGERFFDVCALALGSSLGLCALLMLCSALETTGFREAWPLDERVGQWTTLAFSGFGAFLVTFLIVAAGRRLRRATTYAIRSSGRSRL
jgi:xanthine/uracil permease